MVYAVLTGRRGFDLELQIICHDKASAQREVRELRRDFGCDDARVRVFADEAAVYDWLEG